MPPEPIPISACTIWKPVPCASCHGWRNAKKRARRYGSSQIAAVPSALATPIPAASAGNGVPATRRVPALRNHHKRDPERRIEPLPFEVVVRVPPTHLGGRRRRGVHHHEPERDEGKRDQHEHARFELAPLHPKRIRPTSENSSLRRPFFDHRRNGPRPTHPGGPPTTAPNATEQSVTCLRRLCEKRATCRD